MADDRGSELYLQLAQDKLKRQDESIRLSTTKASILFAACVLFVNGMETSNPIPILLVLAASCLAVFVVWPTDDADGPRVVRVKEILDRDDYPDPVSWIAETCRQCAENNAPKINRNAYALNLGMVLLMAGLFVEFACQLFFSSSQSSCVG